MIRVHDYTVQWWGHALHDLDTKHGEIDPSWWRRIFGQKPEPYYYITCMGHGEGVRSGDVILVKMESGNVGQFRVSEINYYSNPSDMFNLKRADFEGYTTPPRSIEGEGL